MVHLVVGVSLFGGLKAPKSNDLPSPATDPLYSNLFSLSDGATRWHGVSVRLKCCYVHQFKKGRDKSVWIQQEIYRSLKLISTSQEQVSIFLRHSNDTDDDSECRSNPTQSSLNCKSDDLLRGIGKYSIQT